MPQSIAPRKEHVSRTGRNYCETENFTQDYGMSTVTMVSAETRANDVQREVILVEVIAYSKLPYMQPLNARSTLVAALDETKHWSIAIALKETG